MSLTGLQSGIVRVTLLLEASGESPLPRLFQLLESQTPWLSALSSTSKPAVAAQVPLTWRHSDPDTPASVFHLEGP